MSPEQEAAARRVYRAILNLCDRDTYVQTAVVLGSSPEFVEFGKAMADLEAAFGLTHGVVMDEEVDDDA